MVGCHHIFYICVFLFSVQSSKAKIHNAFSQFMLYGNNVKIITRKKKLQISLSHGTNLWMICYK